MLTAETIDRLKAQLLTSGLSQKDSALFQVINLLIDAARQSFVNEIQLSETVSSIPPPVSPVAGFTPGSVLFVGTGPVVAEDNVNFFWNDTLNILNVLALISAYTTTVPAYLGPAPAPGYTGLWFGTAARTFANYSILSDGSGALIFNADAGQSFSFRFNNSELMNISTGGISLTPGTTVAGIGNLTVSSLQTTGTGAVATKYYLSLTNAGTNSYIETDSALASWMMVGRNASLPVFSVTGSTGQTANIMEWLDSASVVLAALSPVGQLSVEEISLPAFGGAPTVGQVTLIGGTLTIPSTAVTGTCLIFLQRITAGGIIGNLTYTQIPGTSFTINSDNALDTSTVNWMIVETH